MKKEKHSDYFARKSIPIFDSEIKYANVIILFRIFLTI